MIYGRHFIAIASIFILSGVHPFLALSRPVYAKVMIIEGWIPKPSLQYAVDILQAGNYELVLTNGGRIEQKDIEIHSATYAAWSKSQLIRLGIEENRIIAIQTPVIHRSRTFSYALSTIQWLRQNRSNISAVNVLTLGAHARKSYVRYKTASQNELDVGIISAPPVGYHPLFWFFSIKGIGFVSKNLIGYLHALIL